MEQVRWQWLDPEAVDHEGVSSTLWETKNKKQTYHVVLESGMSSTCFEHLFPNRWRCFGKGKEV